MSKVCIRVIFSLALSALAVVIPGAAHAGVAPVCTVNSPDPAMLVHVTGFKDRAGIIRVQTYGGDPNHYFDKGTYLRRIDVRIPAAGPLDVCLPVAAPGTYAVAVYHIDPSGEKQGGGTSGNPQTSLFGLLMKRKPSPDKVAVPVGRGTRVVPIVLNYRSGMSFGPVAS